MTTRTAFVRRSLTLVGSSIILAIVGYAGFNLGAFIRPEPLRTAVVAVFGVALLFAIAGSPAVIYALLRGGKSAIVPAITVPTLWHLKEIIRMSEYLHGSLLAYGAVHQLYLALWAWVAATVSLVELILRMRRSRRLAPAPLVVAVIGFATVGLLVLVEGGGLFAEWYMRLYGELF